MIRSQNGWSVDPGLIRSYTVPGTHVQVALRRGDVAVVLLDLAAWLNTYVERLRDDTWGYAYRRIIGRSTVSNHASGCALDVRATRHPLGVRGTWSRERKAAIHLRLRTYDGIIRWGEDYSGRVDGMHFEVNAGATAVRRVADRIRAGEIVHHPAKPVAVRHGDRVLRAGMRGDDVRSMQRRLNALGNHLPLTGAMDEATLHIVRKFQRRHGLADDGVVGPKTWAELRR